MHVRLIERFTERVFRIRRPMTGHTETRCYRRRTNPECHDALHATDVR